MAAKTAPVLRVAAVAPDDAGVLTLPEFARLMRISARQALRLVESGRVAAFNAGMGRERGLWRVSRAELDRLLSPPAPTRGRHLRPPPGMA